MVNRPSNRRNKNEKAPEQVIIEGIFSGLWQVLKWLFGAAGKKQPKKANNQAELIALRDHWEEVELHILQENTRSMAISEADKILDTAFKLKGFPGETMGDRLRSAESWFDHALYNEIWQAHKLRNSLAHEVGVRVNAEEAQRAVGSFRQALYVLGVLA